MIFWSRHYPTENFYLLSEFSGQGALALVSLFMVRVEDNISHWASCFLKLTVLVGVVNITMFLVSGARDVVILLPLSLQVPHEVTSVLGQEVLSPDGQQGDGEAEYEANT